jgi:hypothetical protein
MKAGEVLHDDGPPMDVERVDELVGLHARSPPVELAYSADLTGKVRPRGHCTAIPSAPVTEVLRLARTWRDRRGR